MGPTLESLSKAATGCSLASQIAGKQNTRIPLQATGRRDLGDEYDDDILRQGQA
jgi:hypothetical protein